jgi:8-oxo-dGTP diphosphatase
MVPACAQLNVSRQRNERGLLHKRYPDGYRLSAGGKLMQVTADPARLTVRELVAGVSPYDRQEADHQRWILDWITSGAQLFRLAKPARPAQHLAVYAALVDEESRSVLYVHHGKARAFLMPGGHVDDGEDPRRTVVRELGEELGYAPPFHPAFGDSPFFVSVCQTRGENSHTDVTLWFAFTASRFAPITPDLTEFSEMRWFPLNEPIDDERFGPDVSRAVSKLSGTLDLVAVS